MSRPWCPPPSRQASCSWSPPPVWWPWAWRPRQPWAKPDLPGEGKVQVPGRISVGLFVSSCVRPVSLSGVIVRPTSLSNCTCVAPEYCKQDDLVNQVLSYVTHLVTTKNIQREKVWSTPDMVAQAVMCAASSQSQTGIPVDAMMQMVGMLSRPILSVPAICRTLFSQTSSTTTSPATAQCGVSRVPRWTQHQSWKDPKNCQSSIKVWWFSCNQSIWTL